MNKPDFLDVGGTIFRRDDIKTINIDAENALITVMIRSEYGNDAYSLKCDSKESALTEYKATVKALCYDGV